MYHVRVRHRDSASRNITTSVMLSELKAKGRLSGSVFRANSLVRAQQIARRLQTFRHLG